MLLSANGNWLDKLPTGFAIKLKMYYLVFLLSTSCQVVNALTGENICTDLKSSTVFDRKWETRTWIDTSGKSCSAWCRSFFSFRLCECWKKRVQTEVTVTKSRINWDPVEKCCEGYTKTANKTCEPICVEMSGNQTVLCSTCPGGCKNIRCENTENCKCHDGPTNLEYQIDCTKYDPEGKKENTTCISRGNCASSEGSTPGPDPPYNSVESMPCLQDCHDGNCSNSGACFCSEGHWNHTVAPFGCIPLCSEDCFQNLDNCSMSNDSSMANSTSSMCPYTCSCTGANCTNNSCICSRDCNYWTKISQTQPADPGNLPWGFIGAAIVILIIIACCCFLAYNYFLKKSTFFAVVEPEEGRKSRPQLILEENCLYSTLDVLQGTQNGQPSTRPQLQSEALYENAAFNVTSVPGQSAHEENSLYGAFELQPLPAEHTALS